jgi:hypothetical protein
VLSPRRTGASERRAEEPALQPRRPEPRASAPSAPRAPAPLAAAAQSLLRALATLGAAGLLVGGLGACQEEDTGTCCTAVTAEGRARVPVPDRPANAVGRDIIRANPRFECEEMLCTSFQGSEPVCTRPCSDTRPCREGFECKPIIVSDPGPDATIRPGDTFCVRKTCAGAQDCPDDFSCLDVYTLQPLGGSSSSTVAPAGYGQCVKTGHRCGG